MVKIKESSLWFVGYVLARSALADCDTSAVAGGSGARSGTVYDGSTQVVVTLPSGVIAGTASEVLARCLRRIRRDGALCHSMAQEVLRAHRYIRIPATRQ